jgi:hypothetical protein
MTPAEQKEIEFCIAQIRAMSSSFENQRLPDFAVGAIDGWCNRLARFASGELPAAPDAELAAFNRRPLRSEAEASTARALAAADRLKTPSRPRD